MMMTKTILASLFFITANGLMKPGEPTKAVSSPSFLGASPSNASSEASEADLEMTSAAMETAITDLMLGKTKFGATPMGGSVKQISNIISKDMMPKVLAAHRVDQKNLNRLAAAIAKCGSVKNANLRKAVPAQRQYYQYSRYHQSCRRHQAVL